MAGASVKKKKGDSWQFQHVTSWLQEPTPQGRWLLTGLLPAGSIGWISGPRKVAFKTWMAFLLNMSVASGKAFGPHITPPEPANVWMIEDEGTTPDTKSRFRKIEKGAFGHDFWQSDLYNGRFFWTHHQRIKLDNPAHVRRIIQTTKDNDIKLITLDALTYAHRLDENKSADMRIVADAIMDIRAQTGATFLGIRHTGKQSQREPEDIDLGNRGASVLDDLYDFHLALRRDKTSNDLWMKARYRDHAEKLFNVWWQIQSCDEEWHDPDKIEACADDSCAHRCSKLICDHTATLQLSVRGENDEATRTFEKKVKPFAQPGQVYSFGQLADLLGEGRTKAATRRAEWLKLGLIKEPKDSKKKGWMLA